MKRNYLKEKRGSTLLIAIVIMVVVLMLGLALVLLSKSLFTTVNKQRQMEQCKQITQDLSTAISLELISVENEYQGSLEKIEKIKEKNCFWTFLRCNLDQTNWPYYDSDERGHKYEKAVKEMQFDFQPPNGVDEEKFAEYMDNTKVCISYSKPEFLDDNTQTEKTMDVEITVSCKIGESKSSITKTYELTISEIDLNQEKISLSGSNLSTYAMYSVNQIYPQEKWSFVISDEGKSGANGG